MSKSQEIVARVRIYLRENGLIVPREAVKDFYSQIIKLSGFGLGGILTLAGKKAGNTAANILRELMEEGESSEDYVVEYISVFLKEAGIGNMEKWEGNKGNFKIFIKGSFFATGIKSRKPACLPLQGALVGIFEGITGNRWDCKEVECTAQGKEFCVFELKKKQL